MIFCTLNLNQLSWPIAKAVIVATTVVVIVIEMRKPSYHGIFWKTINPNLQDWWDAKHQFESD